MMRQNNIRNATLNVEADFNLRERIVDTANFSKDGNTYFFEPGFANLRYDFVREDSVTASQRENIITATYNSDRRITFTGTSVPVEDITSLDSIGIDNNTTFKLNGNIGESSNLSNITFSNNIETNVDSKMLTLDENYSKLFNDTYSVNNNKSFSNSYDNIFKSFEAANVNNEVSITVKDNTDTLLLTQLTESELFGKNITVTIPSIIEHDLQAILVDASSLPSNFPEIDIINLNFVTPINFLLPTNSNCALENNTNLQVYINGILKVNGKEVNNLYKLNPHQRVLIGNDLENKEQENNNDNNNEELGLPISNQTISSTTLNEDISSINYPHSFENNSFQTFSSKTPSSQNFNLAKPKLLVKKIGTKLYKYEVSTIGVNLVGSENCKISVQDNKNVKIKIPVGEKAVISANSKISNLDELEINSKRIGSKIINKLKVGQKLSLEAISSKDLKSVFITKPKQDFSSDTVISQEDFEEYMASTLENEKETNINKDSPITTSVSNSYTTNNDQDKAITTFSSDIDFADKSLTDLYDLSKDFNLQEDTAQPPFLDAINYYIEQESEQVDVLGINNLLTLSKL